MTEDHLHHREKFVVSLDILIDNYEVKNVKKKKKKRKETYMYALHTIRSITCISKTDE